MKATFAPWKVGEAGDRRRIREGMCPVPEHTNSLEVRDHGGTDFGWCEDCKLGWRIEGDKVELFGSAVNIFNSPVLLAPEVWDAKA